jgi:hypothetical protein
MHLSSGLSVGLAGVAAGYTIGIVGDAVSRYQVANKSQRGFLTSVIGRPCLHAAIEGLCWHDSYLDFRRSSWALWVRVMLRLV